MSHLKLFGAIIGFIVLGFILCPNHAGEINISPSQVLEQAFAAEKDNPCTSLQLRTYKLYGKTSRRKITVRRSASHLGDLNLIKSNYAPVIEGSDVIAGREVWSLRLKPMQWNGVKFPWKQLWVDKKTSVVLASRDWSCDNVLRSSMKTLSIRFLKTPSGSPSPIKNAAINKPDVPPGAVIPQYIPKGFVLTDADTLPSGQVTISYSNGLYLLSITETTPDSRAIAGEADGVAHDWGQGLVVMMRRPKCIVAVIGDIPGDQLRKIAISIK